MGKISRSLRYVIYIIGTDPLYWGGGGNSEKSEKRRIFNLQTSDRDLNEILYLEGLVTQTYYFKSRPYSVSLGEVGGTVNLGKHLEWRDRDETW